MDNYSEIWGDYNVYKTIRDADQSEHVILSLLFQHIGIHSVIDFGCALGRWCAEAKRQGADCILGIDGSYVPENERVIDEFLEADLGEEIILDRRYDLAISLEVAEHIPENKSEVFIRNLVRASDVILFSAAIPGQGGDFHLNEQWPEYWKEKFEKYGYMLWDCIRPLIWRNERVLPMYRQNCVVFVKKDSKIQWKEPERIPILDIVHPAIFSNVALKGIQLFPFDKVERGKRIVLYGAGTVGNQYYRQLQACHYCREIIWVDKVRRMACVNNKSIQVSYGRVLESEEVDYYVIAVENEETARIIGNELKNRWNVDENKIVWECRMITRY